MTGRPDGRASPDQTSAGWGIDPTEAVILVARVGDATGSRAAAAALACAGSEPDRAGLLIDLGGGRSPRPALVATAAARELEERFAVHLPQAGVASRGQICHLALPADASGVELVAAALPLARDTTAVIHVPPCLFRSILEEPRARVSGALLRADLGADRALTALAARDAIERGLRVAVLKRPLGWVASRRALSGFLTRAAGGGGLPRRLRHRLLAAKDGLPTDGGGDREAPSQSCYCRQHDAEAEPARAAQQERRGDASPRSGRGLHRDPERGAGR